jgi:hypothetical protein
MKTSIELSARVVPPCCLATGCPLARRPRRVCGGRAWAGLGWRGTGELRWERRPGEAQGGERQKEGTEVSLWPVSGVAPCASLLLFCLLTD